MGRFDRILALSSLTSDLCWRRKKLIYHHLNIYTFTYISQYLFDHILYKDKGIISSGTVINVPV